MDGEIVIREHDHKEITPSQENDKRVPVVTVFYLPDGSEVSPSEWLDSVMSHETDPLEKLLACALVALYEQDTREDDAA